MQALTHRFAKVDGRRRSDWERLQRDFARKQEEQERKDKLEQENQTEFFAFAVEVAMASASRITDFQAQLDIYDTSTVTALMENQERLDAVNERISTVLGRAYQLEDGRRVFRTEDGLQVFDQDGNEVGSDFIHPDEIGPEYPTWEEYSPIIEERDELEQEREDLIGYQERLDEAREQIADGQIAEAELDDLEAEFAELMPDAVKAHVPGMEVEQVAQTNFSPQQKQSNALISAQCQFEPAL